MRRGDLPPVTALLDEIAVPPAAARCHFALRGESLLLIRPAASPFGSPFLAIKLALVRAKKEVTKKKGTPATGPSGPLPPGLA